MEKLVFTQSGVYHLHQLAAQMHSVTGKRHKLSDQASVLELLRQASVSRDQDTKEILEAFSHELKPGQKEALSTAGITLH